MAYMIKHLCLAFEPWHIKTNKMPVCPGKSWVFAVKTWVLAVCMKRAWVLSYPLSTQQRLWSDAQTDLSLRWAQSHFVSFVMSRLIYCQIKATHLLQITYIWDLNVCSLLEKSLSDLLFGSSCTWFSKSFHSVYIRPAFLYKLIYNLQKKWRKNQQHSDDYFFYFFRRLYSFYLKKCFV